MISVIHLGYSSTLLVVYLILDFTRAMNQVVRNFYIFHPENRFWHFEKNLISETSTNPLTQSLLCKLHLVLLHLVTCMPQNNIVLAHMFFMLGSTVVTLNKKTLIPTNAPHCKMGLQIPTETIHLYSVWYLSEYVLFIMR